MKLLWIGSYASDEMLKNMPVKSIGQASGVTSQKSLIKGIDKWIENFDVELDTINVQGIPCYPKFPEKDIKRTLWSRNGKSNDISIGFKNTKLVSRVSQDVNLKKEARKWISQNKNQDEIHIFLYEPVLSRLNAVEVIKTNHNNVHCHLIVPDVPEFVGKDGNKIYRFLKNVRKNIVDKKLKLVDDYIFYSEMMATYYNVPENKYTVMEGSIDYDDISVLTNLSCEKHEKTIFMYSGAISSQRGILQFLKSFEKYDNENIELWFTGAGDCDEYIRELQKTDKRIKHFGYLNTREEVLNLETKADALLHIRDKEAISSKYCFPSKMFEYMVSGKPVLSVKIDGIPEEYYDYLIKIEDLSVEEVTKSIEKFLNMSTEERHSLGASARNFILNNKNSTIQAKKILDLANVLDDLKKEK